MLKKVKIEIISGVEGYCVTINNYRIAGPKPWGGGTVVHKWYAPVRDVKKALKLPDLEV